jgi:hypothetical protein
VGLDAEYRFADIRCGSPAHSGNLLFSIDGINWEHQEPIGGPVFQADHRYTYAVVGAGRRLGLRLGDPAEDNYGQLQIGFTQFTAQETLDFLLQAVLAGDLHHGIENSLVAKLNAAREALDAGDSAAAASALADFRNQLGALSGKHVPAPLAQELDGRAAALIALI